MDKKSNLPFIATLLLFLALAGCNSGRSTEAKVDTGAPRTGYGQAVRQGKDLSKQVTGRDREVEKQSEELEGE